MILKKKYSQLEEFYFAYPKLRSTTTDWLPADSEERFDKNMRDPETNKELSRLGWRNNSIAYKFNAQGFRSDDFVGPGHSIMFLGCSHTIGIGMGWENTFSKIIADKLKLKCFNLGKGGGSFDSCFRFASHWIDALYPKIVVLVEPKKDRKEICTSDGFKNYLPKDVYHGTSTEDHDNFYKDWVMAGINGELQRERNLLSVKYLSEKANAKFISLSPGAVDGEARDLMHGGKIWHSLTANQILAQI